MWRFLKRLFHREGYREVFVLDKRLKVYKAHKKYWDIDWSVVGKNVITFLKNWPRPAKYQRYYYESFPKLKSNEIGHFRKDQIKIAVEDERYGASSTFKMIGTLDKPRSKK